MGRIAVGTIIKIEGASFNPKTPLNNLVNRQRLLRGPGEPGQVYDLTAPNTWLRNVNFWFRRFAAATGGC
jgi:hypothetical protein